MKKKILIVVAVAIFGACNTKPKSTTELNSVAVTDTANLNHNANADKPTEVQLNGVSDTIISKDGNEYVKVKPNEVLPAVVRPVVSPVRRPGHVVTSATHTHNTKTTGSSSDSESSHNSTVSSGSSSGTGSTSTTSTTTTTTTPATVSKPQTEYSKAAKGAVIGAGAGAVAGAIISKKKGVGAIIGGVIGAGGGFIIGKGKDKKDGRY